MALNREKHPILGAQIDIYLTSNLVHWLMPDSCLKDISVYCFWKITHFRSGDFIFLKIDFFNFGVKNRNFPNTRVAIL